MIDIDKFSVELMEKISKLGGYEAPDIWSRSHNNLCALWGRNFKDKIKIETLMKIEGVKYGNDVYESNFFFEITPEQAEEIIEVLQTILKNRCRIEKDKKRNKLRKGYNREV